MVEHGDVVQRGVDAQRLDVDLLEPALGKRVADGDVLDGEVRGVDQRVAGRGVRAAHFEHRHVGLVARDRKSTRLNSSHKHRSRMPSSA